jgi:hypothetical protein
MFKMFLVYFIAVLNISWYGWRYLINILDILTGMLAFHWIEEAWVDV